MKTTDRETPMETIAVEIGIALTIIIALCFCAALLVGMFCEVHGRWVREFPPARLEKK